MLFKIKIGNWHQNGIEVCSGNTKFFRSVTWNPLQPSQSPGTISLREQGLPKSIADVMLKFEKFIFLDWSSILRRGAETSASSWISWPSPPALFSHSGSCDFQGIV
jgi:hypothetical protein